MNVTHLQSLEESEPNQGHVTTAVYIRKSFSISSLIGLRYQILCAKSFMMVILLFSPLFCLMVNNKETYPFLDYFYYCLFYQLIR